MSDSGIAPCDSTEEELRNKRKVCAATGTAVEGIYHMPIRNLCIPSNFGIVRCEGMGRGGGGNYLEEVTSSTDIGHIVTVVFRFFGFIPLILKVVKRVISHRILI